MARGDEGWRWSALESQTNERVYAELVSGLLGARTDPATDRFDEELDRAVAGGEVTAAVARRLRFWQRASLRALTDHTRTVLPVTLGALEASRRDAESYIEGIEGIESIEGAAGTDTPVQASTITLPEPISLEGSASRLLVAGLVTTTAAATDPTTGPDIHLENR